MHLPAAPYAKRFSFKCLTSVRYLHCVGIARKFPSLIINSNKLVRNNYIHTYIIPCASMLCVATTQLHTQLLCAANCTSRRLCPKTRRPDGRMHCTAPSCRQQDEAAASETFATLLFALHSAICWCGVFIWEPCAIVATTYVEKFTLLADNYTQRAKNSEHKKHRRGTRNTCAHTVQRTMSRRNAMYSPCVHTHTYRLERERDGFA